jgi:hypothetical protein
MIFINTIVLFLDSNNQRFQRFVVQRIKLFRMYDAPEEPIMNYAHTQKTYGMNNTYR